MNNYLSTDSLFYKICDFIYHILVTSILWLVFSIPVFTIGASTTSAFYIGDKFIGNKSDNIIKQFIKSFRQNFKQSTILWIIYSAANLSLYCIFYLSKENKTIIKIILPLIIIIAFELLITYFYAFYLTAKYYMDIKSILKLSFFLSNRYIILSIISALLFLLLNYALYRLPILMLFFTPGLYILGSIYIIRPLLLKHFPEESNNAVED